MTIEFLGGPKTARELYPKGATMRFSNVQGSGEWDQESWSLLLDRYSKATMNVLPFAIPMVAVVLPSKGY